MIQIEKMYNNIVTITENNYTVDRFNIIKHLFKELKMDILDFEIRIKHEDDIFERYVDIVPYNLDGGILDVLKNLNKIDEESNEDLVFVIKMLVIMKM